MTQPVQLLGSYWTLAVGADPLGDQRCLHDFRLRVETASRAGFTAMGFWHTDLAETRRRYSFREMKRILDDNGITAVEVEWLLDWFCTDQRRAASDQTRQLLLDAAEALGARHIKIGDLGNDCADVPRMAEEFGKLCEQAAERGTNVLFELLPAQFSRAPSLDQVIAICRGARASNGGIMLDILHLQRTSTPWSDIVRKIGRDIPLGVEINDGVLATPVHFQDSVVNKRLLPGDGEFDIEAFLHAVWTQGFDGPVGVEVLNEYMRKWPLETAATESFAKTRRCVDAARKSWLASKSTSHEGTP
ncbi:MAG TPA: sugar phosphate isomerase/epimerase family protein [Steroidobacteraceae bacterium]|nr:sugar phosphate isomerase/epimerase family protein [Steroidobacteraceae bacterium]